MSSVGDYNRCCKKSFESDIRDGNVHDLQLHIVQGHFRSVLDAEPQFFGTCLLLAKNNAQILNILFAAAPPSLMVSPLILLCIILEQLDNLDLLNRLFNLLKSQQYVLYERDANEVLKKAIKIKAPIETFKILLSFGIDPNSYNALKSIIREGGEWSNRVLQCLLDGGADPNPKKICDQPLRFIIQEILPRNESSDNNFMLENIKILLSAKANPNLLNDFQSSAKSPFSSCIDLYSASLIHILVSSKKYPLQDKVLQLLTEGGAEVNTRDRYGRTPLMMAASPDFNNFEFFKLFVKVASKNKLASNNLDLKNGDDNSVLHELALGFFDTSSKHKHIECLLEYGANPDVVGQSGRTPLMTAAMFGVNINIIKLLIERGANVHIQDKDGFTVLHYVARNKDNKSLEAMKLLLRHGANVNLTENKKSRTPLMHAVMHCANFEIIEFLVESGTRLQLQDRDGFTVLHHACSCHNSCSDNVCDCKCFEKIQLLIQHGADPNVTNKKGETPLMIVSKCPENMNIIRLLIDAGTDLSIADKTEEGTVFHDIVMTGRIPFKDLKSLFEGHESSLLLVNAYNLPVFYCLTKSVLSEKPKEEPDKLTFFVDICKKSSKENLLEMSRDIPYILYENYHLSNIIINSKYLDTLLNSPFMVIEDRPIEVCMHLKRFSSLPASSLTLDYNLISALLSKNLHDDITMNMDVSAEYLIQSIKNLENYGFELLSSNVECASPLTALFSMLCRTRNTEYYSQEVLYSTVQTKVEAEILEVASYLINRGASVTESRMELNASYTSSPLYQQFPVPDSLLLALLSGSVECVRLLLPFWPHPPLALLIYVLPDITDPKSYQNCLCSLYPTLAAGGPLPIGSPIHRRVSQSLDEIQDVVGNIRSHFKLMHGEIPSLLYLCRTAFLGSLPGGVDLQEIFASHMPPGMPTEVLNFDLGTKVIQDQINKLP